MTVQRIRLAWLLIAALPTASVRAEQATSRATAPRPAAENALLFDVLGPVAGVVVAEVADGADSIVSLNLRYHRVVDPRVAFTLVPVFSVADILTGTFYSAGLKAGVRVSTAEPGLSGWFLGPLVLVGGTWAWQGGHSLTSAGLVGIGLAGGYAWCWDWLMVELGAGAQYSGYFAHSSFDGSPIPGAGPKPLLELGVGYAW